ncbi:MULTISPECIES: TonB-dependent receptor [Shewanella]|uniref:TonB-dependent receptor n=1 Tax=Shewanella TaxID=22 RepID=UPI000C549A73|nr:MULTISPECIES: TonB-dependent receptor [Shewanella]NCQ44666.1 TonB-dependent receptor [Shewanella frigidimarina]NCO72966.1 TonB-dependent receptor [Shewanella vesiculosa]NCP36009.1 TonB-dependent receptor [Shewanella vesiculosa]NCP68604.1 TonB-dependent receptor [Shewanella vesiculosa]NCP73673.1 TonB-dependent receptor [Shewanella vesiculosa]
MPTHRHQNRSLIALAVSLALYSSLTTAAEDTSTIEVIQVSGKAINDKGMSPKSTKINGPFGDGIALKDIARSVTPITSEMIEQLNITDLSDIQKVSPNSYSASGFGASSLPTIRGQLGELYQDGVRRQAGNNGFGIPMSFNAVEQIDVVKGAPPVLLGTSQRNGGFVNLHSKTAPTDSKFGKITASGGSWDHYRAQLDVATDLVANQSGIRLSAEHIDNGSYYDYSGFKSDSIFVAFRLLPDDVSTWDINVEYYDVEFTDNAGINRPTQALIDNGLYITGQGVQPNGSTIAGANAIVSPTGLVEIDRSQVLTDPDNTNDAQTFLLHSTYVRQLSDNATLKNITYYQHLEREEIAQNSFVEIIDGADTAQNRLELAYQWNDSQSTIAAVDLRYNKVLGYSQFTTEADLPIDLTGPIENRRIPLTAEQQARLVELRPGVFVSPGAQYDTNGDGSGNFSLSDTTDSSSWQTGLAIQHNSQWTDKFSTSIGYRADFYDVQARDPIAPQGQIAASDSIHEMLESGQISLSYKLTDAITTYASASYNESTSNSMGGGNTLGANNQISRQNFATENTLNEVGIKYSPTDSAWYVDAAVFDQKRSLRNRDGSNTGIRTKGFEAQAFFDADPYWFSAGYSYLDARYDDSASSQDTVQVADSFDNSRPDIIQGTGIGAPNFASFAPSNRRVQGLPEQTLTINGGIAITEKWQAGFSGLYTKSYPLDFLATVYIRDQYTLNINTRYDFTPQTSLRLDVNNVTNQNNWRPVFEGGYFGSTLVFPELPVNATLTLQHSF